MKNNICRLFILLFSITTLISSCSKQQDQTLYRIQQDGLYGFINANGEEVIEPQYKYVSYFSKDGYALVVNTITDSIITPPFIIDIADTANLHTLHIDYGYINKNNEIINDHNILTLDKAALDFWDDPDPNYIATKFNTCTLSFRERLFKELELHDGLFIYQDKDTQLFGYKNIVNSIIISAKYDKCRGFHNGFAVVKKPMEKDVDYVNLDLKSHFNESINSCGVINTKGELVVDYEYLNINDFMSTGTTWASSVLLEFEDDRIVDNIREWVYIDNKGYIISGPIQHEGWIYNNNKYPILAMDWGLFRKIGPFYTFINEQGDYMSDFDNDGELNISLVGGSSEMFKDVIRFSEGLGGLYANYRNKEGWYFIDSTMYPVSIAYDSILPFSEKMAAVKELAEGFNERKWGFIKKDTVNNTLVQAIPFKFSVCGSFKDGMAYFANEGHAYDVEGYINKNGEMVWQTKRKKY